MPQPNTSPMHVGETQQKIIKLPSLSSTKNSKQFTHIKQRTQNPQQPASLFSQTEKNSIPEFKLFDCLVPKKPKGEKQKTKLETKFGVLSFTEQQNNKVS